MDRPVEIVAPFKEAIDAIKETGGVSYKYCYQCGLCDVVCPWNRVRRFSIRNIVRQANFGLPEIDGDEIWRCTTCNNCPTKCPRGVKQIDVGVSLRRIAADNGISPAPLRSVRASLGSEGNPLGEPRKNRTNWAEGLNVKTFTEEMDILYFPCCYTAYDGRLKKVAVATANILNSAGIDFGILGAEQNCCGESIRKAGDEDLFKRLARENIKTFIGSGVKRILVSSPHCYHTFKNEYPEFKVNFDIIHISQYLGELVKTGKLKLNKEIKRKITYHDPCYLGRHNNVFGEPREVLKEIPGVELVEMADTQKDSLCCGGGGARIWMDTPKDERFSNLRLEQAKEAGASALVTACPYCIVNFEDSRLTTNNESIEVKDITEIIQEALA
ncbi:MAG TPA: (Fe-S)-binding protein [Dehalococcoidales bacterium]|nr:(Fe-S)-binding protein [Dehalococcoidales bacterium]